MRTRALQLCGTGALATLLTFAGCHKADSGTAPDPNDPAAANLAPASGANDSIAGAGTAQPGGQAAYAPAPRTSTAARSSAAYPAQQQAMPPAPPEDTGYAAGTAGSDQAGNYPQAGGYGQASAGYADEYAGTDGYDDAGYNQVTYAEQPPPPLPQYEQPPCPGDNYLWTPGYWNYAQTGYYWVPGVWVAAPYTGALWTPGYWGYDNSRYGFHHGYWGTHIGFYGAIAYGFGYFGRGYEGGYWNHDNFYYNRSVTRVNETVIRNTYVHNVTINNNYINNRVSYNGGRGGIDARPAAYEMAAAHEQHFAALPAQRQNAQQAMGNRAQFAGSNGGRPQMLTAARPIAVRTAASASAAGLRPVFNQGGFERPGFINNAVARPVQQQNGLNRTAQPAQGQINRAAQPGQAARTEQGAARRPGQPAFQNGRPAATQQPNQAANVQAQQRAQQLNAQAHPQPGVQRPLQGASQRANPVANPGSNPGAIQGAGQRAHTTQQPIAGAQQAQANQQRAQQQQAQQQRVQQSQVNQQRAQQQNVQRAQQQQVQQRAQQQEQQRAQPTQQRAQPTEQRAQPTQQRAQPQEQQRAPQPAPQARPQPEQHAAPQPHAEAPHGGGEHGHN